MRPEELGVWRLPLIVWDLEYFWLPLPLEDLLGVWGLRIFSEYLSPLYLLGVWGLGGFFNVPLFTPYCLFPY